MNLCIVSGKVINEIDLQFIYSTRTKSIGKSNYVIVEIELELLSEQIVKLHAYNELADYIYQNIKQNDFIVIEGKVREKYVQIEKIEMIKS